MRIGPLALTPSIAVTDVGIDSNVFNEWDNPKSDFTTTIRTQADAWLRLGRTRLSGRGTLWYQYFGQYASERALNTDDMLRFDLPLTRFTPWVSGSYLDVRDRPGYEIDARARRNERAPSAGIDFHLSRKTIIGVSAKQTTIRYASDEVYLGTQLSTAFNRDVTTIGGSVRYRLTPLTTIVFQAENETQRFQYSKVRDANGLRLLPGVEFNPFALVSGRAYVGYRRLDFVSPVMPDFTGLVASIDLSYTLLGATRFAVGASRDVQYSFEARVPYYVLTGGVASISQHLFGNWDVTARAGTQRLAYQSLGSTLPPGSNWTDTVNQFGGGIGYRLGRDLRVGLNVDQYRRRSVFYQREYKSLRIGTSVTYGF